jgi:hypothetical protein
LGIPFAFEDTLKQVWACHPRRSLADALVPNVTRVYLIADLIGVWDETGLSALGDQQNQDDLVA